MAIDSGLRVLLFQYANSTGEKETEKALLNSTQTEK